MHDAAQSRTPVVTGILVLVVLAAAETYHYLHWNFDDGYIIYRIARNILNGAGWSFNPGEVHNASTSVLNTVVLASAAALIRDVPLAAHLLGGVWLATGGMLFAWWFSRRFASSIALGAGAALILLLASNATWGLETQLFFCLLAWFLVLEDRCRNSWFVIGLLTLARPDALLIAGIRWLKGYLIDRTLSVKGLLQFLLVLSPWLIFSLIHFHQVFPDTLSAKMWQGRSGYWGTGWVYLKGMVRHVLAARPALMAAYALAVPGAWLVVRDRSMLLYLVLFAFLQQVAYVFLDVPGYDWYFAIADGAAVLLAAYAIGSAEAAVVPKARVVVRTALFVSVLAVISVQIRDSLQSQARDGRDDVYRRVAAVLTERRIPAGPLAAVEVGTFGYYLGDRPIVDLTGLTSTNPEFISGRNNDRFFSAPPPTVLFHSPPWLFEQSLTDDLRFRMMYGPPSAIPDPALAMQYFVLKPDARAPTPEEIDAYVETNYRPFRRETAGPLLDIGTSPDALCTLDQINGQLAGTGPFRLPRTVVGLTGWAIDRTASSADTEVYALLTSGADRYSLKAERVRRSDVSAAFKDPQLDLAGFEVRGAIAELPPGSYRAGIAQRRRDRFVYCEFPNRITLN